MGHATIREVAREAAVSVATVSRALNGVHHVSPALRQRIDTAAAKLGYVMHAGARSLSLSKSNAIGVVLPDLHGEFFSEVLRGLDQAASAHGLQLLLSNIHKDPIRAVEALHSMRGRVDGMIVMAPHIDPDRLFAQLPGDLPAVLINCAPHHAPRAEFRIDNAAAAARITDHLIAGGARRPIHIAGPDGNVEAQARRHGYEAAVASAGLVARVLPGDFREEAGVAAARVLLGEAGAGNAVDAIFAANDMMAIGAMVTLKRAGVAVPDAVAIAGFDDIPLARLIAPGLTTMRVDIAGVGERAVAKLTRIIAGEADHGIECVMPELIMRESSRTELVHSNHAPTTGTIQGGNQ